MKNPKTAFFFDKPGPWHDEYAALRAIAFDCGLDEELKWGNPCYTKDGRNIVLIHGFKDYCAYLFFKGALMSDGHGLLIQQTENVQSARQIRFTGMKDIEGREAVLKGYIEAAIAVEESGEKVVLKKTAEFAMPDEFQARLDEDSELKTAFFALTPGRQRGYLLHFGSAKQAKTREARIDKCTPQILAGKGLED
jgi:uncharacterized protein YdeI (YjbR/CyaY-like superfamily)